MDRAKFHSLSEGDLVEVRCLDELGSMAAVWQASVIHTRPCLAVKGYLLPQVDFVESADTQGKTQAGLLDFRELAVSLELSYFTDCFVKVYLEEHSRAICNKCARYLQEPGKPYRRKGYEIFSPWTCKTAGCSVAWWGKSGSYPADQPTRTARKELLGSIQEARLKIPKGLRIGQLSRTEAEQLRQEVLSGYQSHLDDLAEAVIYNREHRGQDAAAKAVAAAMGIPKEILQRDAETGRKMIQQAIKARQQPKKIRDMDLD